MIPYPAVTSSMSYSCKVRTDLTSLALKTVAANAALIPEKFAAVGRTLRKKNNDYDNRGTACGKDPFLA